MSEIEGYLAKLPADRRAALDKVRATINAKLPHGYVERFQYGMISWCVPESVLPAKEIYNKQPLAFASLGSQKSYMVLHLPSLYGDPKERAWFEKAYKQTGKKLDMGKGCVRFASLEALPLDVVGETVSRVPVDRYVAAYRKVHTDRKSASSKATGNMGTTAGTKAGAKKNSGSAKKPAKLQAAKKPAKKSR